MNCPDYNVIPISNLDNVEDIVKHSNPDDEFIISGVHYTFYEACELAEINPYQVVRGYYL